jgi:hypothetical protein
MTPYVDAAALITLAKQAEETATTPCTCTKTPLEGWQSQPLSLDDAQLTEIATLMREDDPEPTFSEYRPDNVQYWSPDAPIAPRYFPYNRCGVWACSQCGRLYLRYTEGGGYFVDKRIRALRSQRIVDAKYEG